MISQLFYFDICSRYAPLRPPQLLDYKRPFFGGRTLSTITVRNADDEEVVISEREELANILLKITNFKGNKAFLHGIALQMFGATAEQWEDVQGSLRLLLFNASHKTMPQVLGPGERLFDVGPRKPHARSAIKGAIIPSLKKQYPFLNPAGSETDIVFNRWCDRLWEVLSASESKTISDRFPDIERGTFARVDQISKIDWAHSELGSTSISTIKDEHGRVTGFTAANVRHELTLPSNFTRPVLSDLTIRIVLSVRVDELKPVVYVPQVFEQDAPPRLALPRSVSISYLDLELLQFDRIAKEDLLGCLKRALEKDLDVDFYHDRLILAWRNPRTFWGERDVLVRVRTSEELSDVLEELRNEHLVQRGDRSVYLEMVSIDNPQLKACGKKHPQWPSDYEICIRPQLQEKESPKRKRQSEDNGEVERVVLPRRRKTPKRP